jgi:hypothetical protein
VTLSLHLLSFGKDWATLAAIHGGHSGVGFRLIRHFILWRLFANAFGPAGAWIALIVLAFVIYAISTGMGRRGGPWRGGRGGPPWRGTGRR